MQYLMVLPMMTPQDPRNVIHASVSSQPVQYARILRMFLGAHSLTHWYCPPAVGKLINGQWLRRQE